MGKSVSELWTDYKNELSKDKSKNSKLLYEFLKDFELGINVPKTSPGARSQATLLRLSRCLNTIFTILDKDIIKISQKDLHELFKKMKEGVIKKSTKEPYKDVSEFVKNIKVFYGWLKRTERIESNLAEDLSLASHKGDKPAWVYLGQEGMKTLIDNSRGDYRALILFLYDSGLRPQEAWKIKVCDFSEDYSLLNVPKKREGIVISKTFERTIKLKHCSEMIKEYVKLNNLRSNDYLIKINQPAFNQYLKTMALRLFGNPKNKEIDTIKGNRIKIFYDDITTKARGKLSQFKCYDIRHNSACYWLDRYKSNKDLMYRFGWLREDKVFYYSEFLGKRDKIDDEDMMTKEDKNRYEKEMQEQQKEIDKLKKQVETSTEQTERVLKMMEKLVKEDAIKKK